MSRLAPSLVVALACFSLGQAQDGRNVLVVVNTASADSEAIGRYYESKRGVPAANLVRIETSQDLAVDRKTYDSQIRDPIADHLRAHQLQDQILYIVTTKGVPLVIEGDEGAVGDRAAVDSELALLYRHMLFGEQPRFGRADNPYFAVEIRAGQSRPFRRGDEETYLVTRLTGASAVDAVLLIDRGLQTADADGSFYFDFEAQQRSLAAGWLKEAAASLSRQGRTVQLEESRNSLDQLGAASGFATLHAEDNSIPESIEWRAGGVALLMGAPIDVARQSLKVIGQGATGVVATVGDSGRDGQLWPQIFFNAWLNGHNLAESAGLSTRYLSWRNVVIGDPLARPYAVEGADANSHQDFIGSPTLFVNRRIAHLHQKYGSGEQAIHTLIEAEMLASQGEMEAAESRARESLDLDPGLPDTHQLLAGILAQGGDNRGAFDHYKQVLDLTFDQEELHRRLARLAVDQLSDFEAAEPHARWLFAQKGLRDVEATRLWAEVKRGQGELKQAEALYYRLIRSREEPLSFALVALGEIAWEQGELTAAHDFLGQALECDDLADRRAVEELHAELGEKETTAGEGDASVESGDPSGSDNGSDDGLLTRPARIVYRVSPEYPKGAIDNKQQGNVVLRLLIDERGQLVKTKKILGSKRLVRAVEKTLPEWQFEPQLINGRPVVGWVTVAIRFKIETEPRP